jgi:hypothetical protein
MEFYNLFVYKQIIKKRPKVGSHSQLWIIMMF